ncbi:MAG TPA: VWA domain-containing protein, partial [Anaerolineales bacterium]|nr:VWA domain-containing protein [Anaerolineales bacterium]
APMQLLTPLALALAALAIPIILLYMLKLRRKQVSVSSTFLWQKLLREQQANAPWQKLKRNLLLILQLIILAALVFALARPALQVPVVASGSVIVLLDASASMNATDVNPTRFESGRDSVLDLINGLSPASSLTLILVAEKPQTLIAAETDKPLLRQALDNAQATQGVADWKSAFALAAGAGNNSTIVIVSDGGLPESGLPSLPGEVRFIPIGESQNNIAITALALRPAQTSPQLFAEISNYDSSDRNVLLSIYFNDQLIDARQLSLSANSHGSLTIDNLSNDSGIYKATITTPNSPNSLNPLNSQSSLNSLDSLPLDNTAFAVFQASTSRRVLLVSKGNLFLEQLLASLPGIQPFRALPAADGTIQIPNDPFDLYIFDGIIPPELPNANLLLVNPLSNPFFEVGRAYNEFQNMQVNQHALTNFVDWSAVHILQAKLVETPPWAETLIESDAGPLVFAGETNGQRVAALTFDLKESDLPLQIAYPILFSNLINYLAPPSAFDATQSLTPGESLSILPQSNVDRIVVASPSNQAYTLSLDQPTFTQTDELGYYAVNFISGDSNHVEYFAVNLFDENESNIQPRETIQVGRATITPTVSQQIGQRELWTWLAALALLVLMIEWQVFHRKQIQSLPIFKNNLDAEKR